MAKPTHTRAAQLMGCTRQTIIAWKRDHPHRYKAAMEYTARYWQESEK